MRALVWEAVGTMRLHDIPPVSAPSPGWVVLQVEAVGICGSEVEGYLGRGGLRTPPLLMGHEVCGIVVAPAAAVERYRGRRIAVNPLLTCGRCSECLGGRSQLCSRRRLVGVHLPGGFAEQLSVPETQVVPLPERTPAHIGALSEPMAVALHALRAAGCTRETSLAVWGAGGLGFMTAVCSTALGCVPGAVLDVDPGRLAAIEAVLPGRSVDAGAPDLDARLRRVAPEGFDVVVEAVGRSESRKAALTACRPGGTVVLLGLHDGGTTLDLNAAVRWERRLLGSYTYQASELVQAAAVLRRLPDTGWLQVRALEDGPAAFAELAGRRPSCTKVVLTPGGGG